jgi:hypothetical protein
VNTKSRRTFLNFRKSKFVLIVYMLTFVLLPIQVSAQVPSSSNYSVPESGFSSGSEIDANSASYNARTSIGDLGIGQSESGNYIGFGGFITPDEEYVELNIPLTTVDMGVLEPGTPGTGTATFTARAYLNNTYVIISPRDPPTSEGGAQIDPMTTATTFNATTEQFGMNLVANTAPVTQGADPSRMPLDNGTFAFGEAAAGYDTANNYQYNAGDIIAESVTRGYGETEYTISYMLNITSVTPAGLYRMEQDLVITATF